MAVYATYADIEHSLDGRILGELCADAGASIPGPNPMTTAALERGTATLRAYCRVGEIYSDAELTTLSTAKEPLLVAIVVDLAIEFLYQRRGFKLPPAIEQRVKQAYSYLEALRDGKMIFGTVTANAQAGLPMVASVPLQNLYYYDRASNSAFFPPRRDRPYP
jgi:hypothetical protein